MSVVWTVRYEVQRIWEEHAPLHPDRALSFYFIGGGLSRDFERGVGRLPCVASWGAGRVAVGVLGETSGYTVHFRSWNEMQGMGE